MKVGTIFISSKLSANKAFKKPAIENRNAVIITTSKVKGIFWILISVKIKDVNKTRNPTIMPLTTPPKTNPIKIRYVGIGETNNSSMLLWNLTPKKDETTFE